MIRARMADLLAATGASLERGAEGAAFAGVSTDTRSLQAGALYVALSGPNFDGNRFAEEAAARGAAALLLRADDGLDEALDRARLPADLPVAVAPDPLVALGRLAAWHRARLACPVIGVTGSCGKTTTKEILAALLGEVRTVVASPKSFNNAVGVPLTLLLADATTEAVVLELGTSGPGEIAALCEIASPSAGIVTNIGSSHLERLGSIAGVALEKSALPAALPKDGFVVLNADCRYEELLRTVSHARPIRFSVDGDGELDARDVLFHAGGTSFRVAGREVVSPLLGTHNVQNLLAALAACLGLGHTLEDVLPGVQRLHGAQQRLERHECGGLVVLDDTYNANPDSARAAVRTLAGLHGHRRRVLVLGEMLELGSLARELHHGVGALVAEARIDLFVTVGELAQAAAAGALEHGLPAHAVVHVDSAERAVRVVPDLVGDGDVVLLKASRGVRLERVVAALLARAGETADLVAGRA